MIEDSDIVCPSCGVAFATTGSAGETAVCPGCRTECDTGLVDREHPSTPSEAESAETMSVMPGAETRVRSSKRAAIKVPKQIGRFEVKKVLGSGGFGNVYQAHDPLLDREVALKVPRLSDDDRQEQLFLHEAKSAARLRHPNIVAVFECGVADDQPYIASEFVDGTPLSDVLRTSKLTKRQAVEIVRQIAEAIHYAHSEGIIHRDLKPSNIMMSRSTRPQVMDFGLARLGSDSEQSLMSEGSIVGTPAYMSPEQARGDKDAVGPRSDQYSVGVLLYLMLCGQLPYQGETWSIISKVGNPDVQPKTPRAFREDVPRDLEACCLRAMEKDPQRRYDNLSVFADDLNHWLEGRPLLARPIGPRERLVRWCQRNRLIAGLMAVIIGLVLAALIVGYVLAFKFSTLAAYANDRADAELRAKREAEQLLIDTFTESGLDASRNGRQQEAVLWFGSAAARAADYPRRERMNRIRFQTWMSRTPIPVRMFRALRHWHKSLLTHESGQYVLSEQRGAGADQCQIWEVASGKLWELPWDAPIAAACWSGDGRMLALGSGSEVRTYSFPDGRQLDRWQHDQSVSLIRFTQDSNKIAVGCGSSLVVHEPALDANAKAVKTPASVVSVCWNPSGNAIAVLCSDQKVYVWPADKLVDGGQLDSASSCVYHAEPPTLQFIDDDFLVVPDSESMVRCWDIKNDRVVWSVPCGRDPEISVAPGKDRVAILDRAKVFQVDAGTGEEVAPTLEHPNLVYDAVYDSTGTRLLTGCADQFARVFSAESGDLIASMRHSDMVHRVAWFPGRQACVTAHWKADLVRVWKLGVAPTQGFERKLHGRIMHVKWNDDGSRFLPCGFDIFREAHVPRILNATDGTPVGKPISFPGRVSDGCFVAGTPNVFIGGSATADRSADKHDLLKNQDLAQPGLIVAANVDSGEPLFPAIETSSNVVALESSGSVVVALCHDHSLLLIDPKSGTVLHRHKALPGADFFYGFVIFRRLAFSPTGDRFVVWGAQTRTAEVRSAVDGSLLFKVSHTNPTNLHWLHDVRFSPDGNTMATCSADQTVQLWNANSGKKLPATLWHTGWVFAAEFSQDGKRLLTSCQDRQTRLWDLSKPDKPILITPAQNDEVYATCFLPGEEIFLIGLRNGEVSAWDARQGKMISPGIIESSKNAVYMIALSPNQSRVIIVGRDQQLWGYHPSRWQPEVSESLPRDALQSLGETIASQELFDGVLSGLTNETLIDRWEQLFSSHADHEIFRWPNKPDTESAR